MQSVDILNEIDKHTRRAPVCDAKRSKGRLPGIEVAVSENRYEPPVIRKRLGIDKMNARHHEIVRLHVLGYKENEIAERLDIKRTTVTTCLASPIVKAMISQVQGDRYKKTIDLRDQIEEILPDALGIMRSVIDNGNLNDKDVRDRVLQVSTSKYLMEVAGYSPVKRVEAKTQTTHLTAQDIKDIVAEAKGLGMCTSDTIDVECTEVENEQRY